MELNSEISELIGAIIGDGCIYYSKNFKKYFIEIVGNPLLDKSYFNHLSLIIQKNLNKTPNISVRFRGLRLKFYLKEFLDFLVKDLKLPYCKEKGKNIFIPVQIVNNKLFLKKCIRGIADTDGSLFFADKGYRKDYPCIEITSISVKLVTQLKQILEESGFRVGLRMHQKTNYAPVYRISINGDIMVKKWIDEIGFSNERHLRKYPLLK